MLLFSAQTLMLEVGSLTVVLNELEGCVSPSNAEVICACFRLHLFLSADGLDARKLAVNQLRWFQVGSEGRCKRGSVAPPPPNPTLYLLWCLDYMPLRDALICRSV